MKDDEVVAEVRATRADLDRLYPTARECYRFLKAGEKKVADRLVRLKLVRLRTVRRAG